VDYAQLFEKIGSGVRMPFRPQSLVLLKQNCLMFHFKSAVRLAMPENNRYNKLLVSKSPQLQRQFFFQLYHFACSSLLPVDRIAYHGCGQSHGSARFYRKWSRRFRFGMPFDSSI
jgi:hypothetical protein